MAWNAARFFSERGLCRHTWAIIRPMSDRLFLRLGEDELHGPEADVPAGTLRAFAPSAVLRPYVSSLMLYRERFAPGTEVIERVVPDGMVRLVFNLGDALSGNDDASSAPTAAIGATAAPALVRLRGSVHAFSVTLRPGAVQALLGLPAGEFNDSGVPLADLWGREAAEVLERVAEQRSDAARAHALDAALQARVRRHDTRAHAATSHALQCMAASAGTRPLREVAAEAGVGERRLQQLFHAQVGLSPRAWSRLLRLQACLRRLRAETTPRWAELALECGFYDQSHLVNEFQAVCGLSPTHYWQSAVSGSSKTPA
jgi:AraC-like DNA-binding protein